MVRALEAQPCTRARLCSGSEGDPLPGRRANGSDFVAGSVMVPTGRITRGYASVGVVQDLADATYLHLHPIYDFVSNGIWMTATVRERSTGRVFSNGREPFHEIAV